MGRSVRMSLAGLALVSVMAFSEAHLAPEKTLGDELIPQDPTNVYPPEGSSAPDELKRCPDACSAHGDCVPNGGKWECHCDDGYTGDNCASLSVPLFKRCPKDCSMHGSCVRINGEDACHCDKGWSGVDCSERLLSQVTDPRDGTRTTFEELNLDPNLERVDTHIDNGLESSHVLVGSGNSLTPTDETRARPMTADPEHEDQGPKETAQDTLTPTPTPTRTPTPTWNLEERSTAQPRMVIVNGTIVVTPTPTPTTVGFRPPADCTSAEQEVFELCAASTMDGKSSCDSDRCEFVSNCDCIYPNGNEVCGPGGTGVCLPLGREIQELCAIRYSSVRWRTFGLRRGTVHISDLGGCPVELGGVSYAPEAVAELSPAAIPTNPLVALAVATLLALCARM